jgi:hypothetical protein
MGETAIHHNFTFSAELVNKRQVMGLQIEVVPWMRGAVVMP